MVINGIINNYCCIRMLGYDDAICAVTSNQFGIATSSVPFWMDSVLCLGSEEALDQCSFPGWANTNCSHATQDAGVVCKPQDGILCAAYCFAIKINLLFIINFILVSQTVIGVPYNITLVISTKTSLTLSWNVSF